MRLRRRLLVVVVCLVVGVGVFVGVGAVSGVAVAGSGGGVGEALTWAPPEGWEDFEEFVIPAEGGTFKLDPLVDYRISAPEVIRGEVALKGGRNVVWIGGEWDVSGFGTPAGSATDRRALMINDRSGNVVPRVVHLEGLLIGGEDLSEGIDISAPLAVVQIQNVHVAGVHLRGADDRDSTGPYDVDGWSGNHADVLQPWGGYLEIRIDGLTGRSMYQGFYYLDDLGGTGNSTKTYLRRMNLEAIQRVGPDDGFTYTGHRMFRWDDSKTGQIFIDNGTVWAKHHPDSSWAGGYIYKHAYRDQPENYPDYDVILPDPSPGTATFEDTFYPDPIIGSDALGEYAWWDDLLDNGLPGVRNWDDTAAGRFYSGAPPQGDYVPAATVGIGYQSPGYQTGTPTTTTTSGPTTTTTAPPTTTIAPEPGSGDASSSFEFQAPLLGENEVPAVDSAGGGLATFSINAGSDTIDYSIFVYGLTDIVGGHVHVGKPGDTGGVAVDLLDAVAVPTSQDGWLLSGVIGAADLVAAPADGYDGSFDQLVSLMRWSMEDAATSGDLYVNIHTNDHPGGELRGPIGAVDTVDNLFSDTVGNVHQADIDLIANAGITKGCGDGDFCPNSSITRGQFAALLRRALNLPASDSDFFDDDETSIFEGDINAIAEFGITTGCNPPANDEFCPDDVVTRGQMAALWRRAFNLPASDSDFFDDDETSIFEGDINAIAEFGITKGCNPPTNDEYCPGSLVTRAQMASFIARSLGWA